MDMVESRAVKEAVEPPRDVTIAQEVRWRQGAGGRGATRMASVTDLIMELLEEAINKDGLTGIKGKGGSEGSVGEAEGFRRSREEAFDGA